MGGKLVVESELGAGTTFRARIPGVAVYVGELPIAATPVVPKNPPEHVLIVDDSAVNRAVLTAFLKRAGVAAVDHAGDGVEALAALESAIVEEKPYDFVFSDLWMPNMNGVEFVEKLRSDPRFEALRCFALTADTEFRRDTRTRFFTGVLLKPLTYAKLVEALAVKHHG